MWGSPRAPAFVRASSPGESASASRSPGHWSHVRAILLADEPTGNLDSAAGAALLELLEELGAQGATIVVITHDTGLAARLPRQVQVLDGQIVADTSGLGAVGR